MTAGRTTGIIDAIRDFIRDHRRQAAAERLDEAVKDKARANSDSVYHFEMAKYYRSAASAIDPEKDWHGFAAVRQKLEDSRNLHQHHATRYSEASAKLEAMIASRIE